MERFVVAEYNARPHSETGEPPARRWGASGIIPRAPARPEDLDLLLLTAATTRKVQRDGIRFASTRYVSAVLAAYVGEQVAIRFNPRDVGEIRVYHDDAFLCRAIAPELAAESFSLQQLQAARTQRRNELKQQLRNRRSLADALPPDTRHAPDGTSEAPPPMAPAAQLPALHGLRLYETD